MKRIPLWCWVAAVLAPLAWVAFTSVKTPADILRAPWALPCPPVADNFRQVLRDGDLVRGLWNSLLVTAVAVAVTTGCALPAGYALARLRVPGAPLAMALLALGLAVPVHVTLLPLTKLMGMLGLADRLWGLALLYAAFAFPLSTHLLCSFFRQSPRDLEDAARVDGCSHLRLLWSVVLPMARPAIVTVCCINVITFWNEFVFALMFLDSPERFTVSLALKGYFDAHGVEHGPVCAGIVLALAPTVLLFLAAHRTIIPGMAAGATKE